ncbi:unnamed protein product [Rotaria sp. Silwood2]|nr:unnamed protein product [Rotaria sp. Silwood2]CAF3080190.1 unnamed protein product [Rotaria sp. Silwood2]CAF3399831.1 unnamed protein product [Rotaria sp. Silwood2]CAF4298756.1 unnamed protein product [Rotaria sp. Silwood2]CAF4399939.1 unnamed protein product [Rotaria sp. Silwood2]
MIKLLCFTPNMYTIKFRRIAIQLAEYESIEQSESFRLVSDTNNIKNMTLERRCTLRQIQLLIALCPRLESFTTEMNRKEFLSIIRFLLSENNANTRHLYFSYVLNASEISLRELQRFIKLEGLFDDYKIDYIN